MIVFVGANGITAWNLRVRFAASRQLVCLNDGFSVDFPIRAAKNPRQMLVAMREHSEQLNGRTLSVSEIRDLT